MKIAIIVFPGTNCDNDTKLALEYLGHSCDFVWHNHVDLATYELVILPGGFSYGDYVGAGRLAKFSPVLSSIKEFISQKQGFLLGICNGFQILCESKLLPGALIQNQSLKFVAKDVKLTFRAKEYNLPIAHKEGCYYISEKDEYILKNYELIRYNKNPNGSYFDIAGIYDRNNMILGLMPHPERAVLPHSSILCGIDFFKFIENEIQIAKESKCPVRI